MPVDRAVSEPGNITTAARISRIAAWRMFLAGARRSARRHPAVPEIGSGQRGGFGMREFLKRFLEYLGALLIVVTLRFSPRPAAEKLARGYALLLDRAVPRLRRTACRNLGMALPGADPDPIVDGVFRSIARLLLTFARFPGIDRQSVHRWLRCEGFEHFEEARRRGKGVLFATAHIGNWELSAFAHALLAEPMHIVVRPLDNPWIDRLVARRRSLSGNHLIAKKEAARPILRALARNQAVGILIDQNTSLEEGVFIDFFGIPACANTAFVKLAHRSGAAVIPGLALWAENEQRYVLRFWPAIEITGDVTADTQRLHAIIEAVIRDHPDQWLWIHRRWKTRPADAPSLY